MVPDDQEAQLVRTGRLRSLLIPAGWHRVVMVSQLRTDSAILLVAWPPVCRRRNPPPWLFGPVWTALYTMMGVAAWRVWRAGGGPLPLGLYAAQLVFNFAWSPLFFKAHNLKAATADITALVGLVAATAYEFSKVGGWVMERWLSCGPRFALASGLPALAIGWPRRLPARACPAAGLPIWLRGLPVSYPRLQVDQTAALLLVPYLGWGSFATGALRVLSSTASGRVEYLEYWWRRPCVSWPPPGLRLPPSVVTSMADCPWRSCAALTWWIFLNNSPVSGHVW